MVERTLGAILALSDGTVVRGKGLGAEKEVSGELVFCTAMTGYEEALTDPSYNGQILLFTYPLIGNYGTYTTEFESERIQAEGAVVREACREPSNAKAKKTFHEFLLDNDVPAVEGVDTRSLTVKLRERGTMPAILHVYSGSEPDLDDLLAKARDLPSISSFDLVSEVTRGKVEGFYVGGKRTIAVVDCGVKKSIVKALLRRNVNVVLFPARSTAKEVLSIDPDGVLFSNGPGDPAILNYVFESVRGVVSKVPVMGICLGHQVIALALGAKTYKMKFGHRGINQPVKDLDTGRIYITSHNHGFAVDENSLKGTGLRVRQVSLNDGAVEGMVHEELPVITTQYHPEGHLGPQDNENIFDEFLRMVSMY